MKILYLGKYKKRFAAVIAQLKNLPKNSQILELCFGDIYIAEYCKRNCYHWTGIDLNEHFVHNAKKSGYEAYYGDLASTKALPRADVCVMMGSLYHFHPHTGSMLEKMIKAADMVILSEPILNLSSKNGLIGFFAKRAANAGKGEEAFRFNEVSLMAVLKKNMNTLNYHIYSIQNHGKDLVVTLKRK